MQNVSCCLAHEGEGKDSTEMWGLEGTREGLNSDLVGRILLAFWFLLASRQSPVGGLQ